MLLGNSKDIATYRFITFEELRKRVEQIIYKLEENQVMEDITDIMEEMGITINEFKSTEEVKEYLKRKIDNPVEIRSKIYNLQKIETLRKKIVFV